MNENIEAKLKELIIMLLEDQEGVEITVLPVKKDNEKDKTA